MQSFEKLSLQIKEGVWNVGHMEVNAAQFRWNCFKILDQIKLTRGEVIITKRGKPIAKLMHISQEKYRDPLLGSMEARSE